MLTSSFQFRPHDYQSLAIDHILKHPYCGCFLDMGLGKSAITLSAISELFCRYAISKVLIIAPKKVAEATWQSEIAKWAEFNHLSYSTVMGTVKQRVAAINTPANIYITNRDNVVWLVSYLNGSWPFDMVILDESTSFKSHSAQRFKVMKRIRPKIKRLVELSGTPSPNSIEDLWSQLYLLDMGERLGSTFSGFRQRYFMETAKMFGMFSKWEPKPGADNAVANKISDICISMKSIDHLKLPDITYDDRLVRLDEKSLERYRTLEREMLLETDEFSIEAMSATALMNKLLQLCNGAVYTGEDHVYGIIHDCKLDALEEMVEDMDHVLVFYNFIHDKLRICNRLKGVRVYEDKQDLEDWNNGKIKILLAHPASTAYGLNMQQGGHHIIWFGLTWNYELYSQANARLYRQGQKNNVIVHHLLIEGSRDMDVLKALQHKDKAQDYLIERLKADISNAKHSTH